jgi:hypothetical protein
MVKYTVTNTEGMHQNWNKNQPECVVKLNVIFFKFKHHVLINSALIKQKLCIVLLVIYIYFTSCVYESCCTYHDIIFIFFISIRSLNKKYTNTALILIDAIFKKKSVTLIYSPRAGSIRGLFLSVTSSIPVNYAQS